MLYIKANKIKLKPTLEYISHGIKSQINKKERKIQKVA